MLQDFSHCKMEYRKDEQGKDVLLKDEKFQVMMEWEKPYMHACIDALQPFGDVLEVGFGLGYSADRIQSYSPKSHTIVEYHPVVAAHAREWAKRYPNVVIIEDTWQNALSRLGVFDCIFFDDYPLQTEQEMQKMQEESLNSQLLLKKTEQIFREVEKTVPFLSDIKYSDEDLNGLLQKISLEQKNEVQQLARFLKNLFECGQISKAQLQDILNDLMQRKKLSKDEIETLMATKIEEKSSSVSNQSERLFEFLSQCLASHMRKNSRFSCFLSSAVSKFQDEKFVNEIIINPQLDYHEEEIEIDVPENCSYFSGDKALVITISLAT